MTEPGAAVDVGSSVRELGGRQVHLVRRSGRTPTVLFLGGCAVPSYAWDPVLDLLDGVDRVCLDRPGLVDTVWPDRLPTLAEEAETLADLVALLGPTVLVAHSMASLHAEALLRTHPQGVAGLVLVDGSIEWHPRHGSARLPWLAMARLARRLTALPLVAGVPPLADRALVALQSRRRRLRDPMPPRETATFRRPDTVANVVAEVGAFPQQLAALSVLRRSTTAPEVPSFVLSAGDTTAQEGGDQPGLAAAFGAHRVVLHDSRHLIMYDRPDAVADAIRSVLAEVADGG